MRGLGDAVAAAEAEADATPGVGAWTEKLGGRGTCPAEGDVRADDGVDECADDGVGREERETADDAAESMPHAA